MKVQIFSLCSQEAQTKSQFRAITLMENSSSATKEGPPVTPHATPSQAVRVNVQHDMKINRQLAIKQSLSPGTVP